MAYDDRQLVDDLRALMKKRKVSLRALSEAIRVPYRSMQNYLANESRIPAEVLVNALDHLGADLRLLRNGDSLLHHGDLYDSVWSVFGDLLAEFHVRDLGRNKLSGQFDIEGFQRKQRMAFEIAVRLSEAYDRNVQDHIAPGARQTIKELRALNPAGPPAKRPDAG